MTWRALKFLAVVVLVLLYSRIVYALWFKSSDGELTRHQQVRLQSLLNKRIVGTPPTGGGGTQQMFIRNFK